MRLKLYHGTSSNRLASIQQNGLRPRGKRKGNWEEYPSRHDMVYLSSAYAPYFALNTEGGDPLVLEIDTDLLDEKNFFPDEDFIAQSISQSEKLPLGKVHAQVRRSLLGFQHYWQLSIEKLGNCCHKGVIPYSAITRTASWEVKKQLGLSQMAMDPCISPLNFLILSEKYIGLIAWLFGDRADLPGENFPAAFQEELSNNPYYAERAKYLEEASKNRDGIVVSSLVVHV
mgnify:CR=1 FL=1